MTVSDMKVGERLFLGSYGIGDYSYPISWLKATRDSVFLSEFVLDILPFDTTERSGWSYVYNNNYEQSNILQFLNVEGQGWFVKTHPDDTIAGYFAQRSGFLTDFDEYELDAIKGRIDIPASEDIYGVQAFELFKRKGRRGRPCKQLTEHGQDASGFISYMLNTADGINVIHCIAKDGRDKQVSPCGSLGVRPKCVIKGDTKITKRQDGSGYDLESGVISTKENCTVEDIKTLLGLL